MAQGMVLAAIVALLIVCASPAAEGRTPSRRLNSPYPKSGSSPDVDTPTLDVDTSTPDVDSPTPDTDTTPVSTITLPLLTSSPTRSYGGYGSHAGFGTPKYWLANSGAIPSLLSVLSMLSKLFGPPILSLVKPSTLMGALKDESPDAFPSLAREGAASLINAYAYSDFPLSASDVVSQLNSALESPELAREQAFKFQRLNEAL